MIRGEIYVELMHRGGPVPSNSYHRSEDPAEALSKFRCLPVPGSRAGSSLPSWPDETLSAGAELQSALWFVRRLLSAKISGAETATAIRPYSMEVAAVLFGQNRRKADDLMTMSFLAAPPPWNSSAAISSRSQPLLLCQVTLSQIASRHPLWAYNLLLAAPLFHCSPVVPDDLERPAMSVCHAGNEYIDSLRLRSDELSTQGTNQFVTYPSVSFAPSPEDRPFRLGFDIMTPA
ncbi:hypothetical protein CI1B_30500 [Bradyrhizobium ivorense]|uniref:Uncharacterized protein n=1 Tax=Bradyrhizobium ivorense TaxID=2511166 RepID=A0A508T8C5_9BRAD|nr:hypothetical protein CI41S_21780 [Bradyrhizobium ivorense]VIO70396.1 hypothetical protein CI1B_30500 [Bradyrhizobium ivorense]